MRKKVKTPCIGLCSTVYGDWVCRGCKRFHLEVIDWNTYSFSEKKAVWQRLEQLLTQVVLGRFHIQDALLLQHQLRQRAISFDVDHSAGVWLYQLLLKGARLIQNLEAYGVQVRPEYQGYSLLELRDQIDQNFYSLSYAYYERHMLPALQVAKVS